MSNLSEHAARPVEVRPVSPAQQWEYAETRSVPAPRMNVSYTKVINTRAETIHYPSQSVSGGTSATAVLVIAGIVVLLVLAPNAVFSLLGAVTEALGAALAHGGR